MLKQEAGAEGLYLSYARMMPASISTMNCVERSPSGAQSSGGTCEGRPMYLYRRSMSFLINEAAFRGPDFGFSTGPLMSKRTKRT